MICYLYTNSCSHQSQNRLADLVAEHLDHLHYLNDIVCLNITDLNHVLTDHLLHKLLIPLYIYSLTTVRKPGGAEALTKVLNQKFSLNESNGGISHELSAGKVSCVVALFLLSQVCLIISHSPLVQTLAWIILKTDRSVFDRGVDKLLETYEIEMGQSGKVDEASGSELSFKDDVVEEQKNITDEEKQRLATTPTESDGVSDKPFLETVYNALDCSENDYAALFALSLLYAMAYNKGKVCLKQSTYLRF